MQISLQSAAYISCYRKKTHKHPSVFLLPLNILIYVNMLIIITITQIFTPIMQDKKHVQKLYNVV